MLAACTACGEDTGIIVVVDTDLAVPNQVDGFRVTVKSSSAEPPKVETFDLRPGGDSRPGAARPMRPVRVGLRPANPNRAPIVTVEAAGLRGSGEIVHNRAELSFRRGVVYTVSLPLNAACSTRTCPLDHVCTAQGGCVAVAGQPPGAPDAGDAGAPPTNGPPGADAAPGGPGPGPGPGPGGPGPADGPAATPNRPPTPEATPPADAARPPDSQAPPVDARPPPVDARPPPVDAPPPPVDAPPPRRPIGATCQTGGECQSNACVDGLCCDGPCAGLCRSCRATETGRANGQCAPVQAGADPGNECAAQSPASCGLDGACDGQGACRRHVTGTQCAPGGCSSNSSYSPPRTCGGGTCQPATPQSCERYICTPSGCLTTCQNHDQCAETAYCEQPACVDRKGLGAACRSDRECSVALGLGCVLGLCTL